MNLKVCFNCGLAFTPQSNWQACPECGTTRQAIDTLGLKVKRNYRKQLQEVKSEATHAL